MDTLDHGLSGTGRGSSNPMAFARSTLSCWHVLTYLILRHTSSLASPSRPLCGAFPGDQPPVVVIVSWHSFWSDFLKWHEKSIPFPFVTKSPSLIQAELEPDLQPGGASTGLCRSSQLVWTCYAHWSSFPSGLLDLQSLPQYPARRLSGLFMKVQLAWTYNIGASHEG